ncbi:MAG: AMP-binding protein [Gammaproteobacteria bacterium]|nr:AMP-binding protein [Gammaproteobacteria bacterium]
MQTTFTLHNKLAESVTKNPNKVALQIQKDQDYQQYTYKQLHDNALSIAYYLINNGIKPKDKIAITLENRPEWAMIYFGIIYAGAIAIPLDPQAVTDELQHCLEDADVKTVFTGEQSYEAIQEINKKLPAITSIILIKKIEASTTSKASSNTTLFSEIIGTEQAPATLPDISSDALASIVYTSGTTGKPKGVMLSHNNFSANFNSSEQLNIITEKDNILSILPLHHSFPFMVTLLIPLFAGGTITYLQNLRTEDMTKCMQETDVTSLIGVPQLYTLLCEKIQTEFNKIPWYVKPPLKLLINILDLFRKITGINLNKQLLKKIHERFGMKLRFFGTGGAKLNREVSTFLTKIGFTVLEGYGLTETSPVATFNPQGKAKLGSAGKAVSGVKVKIHEPNSEGIGEIIINGQNIMQGYYKHPKETAEVLIDDWFYSGDLGYLDNEGYLYITGRKKELIVLSTGKNITPEEVEIHYAQSPYIKELAILAVGEKEDDTLKAVIVPNLDVFRKKGLVNINGTIKWDLEGLSKNYPAYKRVTGFIVAKDDLPRTRLGKLKRFAIKERYWDELVGNGKPQTAPEVNLSTEDLELLANPLTKQIFNIINASAHKQQEVLLDNHLEIDLGFDSLHRIELMATLEKEFNIKIPDTAMAEIFTVRELIETITKLSPTAILSKEPAKTFSWKDILTKKPADDILENINEATSKSSIRYTKILCAVIYGISKPIWKLKAKFAQEFSKDQAYIFCANHASYLDGPFIGSMMPRWLTIKTAFIGYRGYFNTPLMRWFARIFRIITINQASELVEALQVSTYLLKQGNSICIFPAGTRSIDGKVQEFRKGIGILGKELNIPLVPVYVKGSYEAFPRDKALPRPHPVTIIYGAPQNPEELQKEGYKLGAEDDYEAITLAIREKIIALADDNTNEQNHEAI